MRLPCCGSPLPTATLGNVDDVGPSRRHPLRACCRFWTANLLMSESGTSTRPFPLFCHLTSPDSTVRGPHRGVAPLLLTRLPSPAPRVHPDLLCPCFCHHPPSLHPVLAISPATPLRDGFRTAFPAGHFFCQSLPAAKRSLLPKHPVAPSTPPLRPSSTNVGGDHSPYRNGDHGGAVGSITLDPSNLIL